MISGILLVEKPLNWTSFDVVNKVRRVIENSDLDRGSRKRFPVGHTGTLDPLATGLLVLLIGDYTKRAASLTKLDKTYEVIMELGQNSTTGDKEGKITPMSAHKPSLNHLNSALNEFTGDIMQTPPIYSAIKVGGKRAYKIARGGEKLTLQPRPVKIYSLVLRSYEYPYADFVTEVSSGTYIRSLVVDLGITLGTGAYLKSLKRTKVGEFNLEDAVAVDDITAIAIDTLLLK